MTRPLTRVLGVLAVVALVVVAAGTADRATVVNVLAIPDYGTVRAELLANGTPVFVVARPPEEPDGPPVIDVIQAFTTEVSAPVTGLVGWCADSGMFVDAHMGPLYDVRGRRLPSTITGREPAAEREEPLTALDDLIHRVVQPVEGRLDVDDPIEVSGIQPLQPWQVQLRPLLNPDVPPGQCRLDVQPPVPDPSAQQLFRRLIDHSFYATSVDPSATGWQITTGFLVLRPNGTGVWCDDEPTFEEEPRCAEPRGDIEVALDLDPAQLGGLSTVIGGPLAVRMSDGAVRRAAVMADSVWRGPSLRGTARYNALLVGSWNFADPSITVTDVTPTAADGRPDGGAGTCLSGPPDGRNPLRVASDSLIDVDGVTASGLDQLPLTEGGVPVHVVLDAVTCRVLLLTDPEA